MEPLTERRPAGPPAGPRRRLRQATVAALATGAGLLVIGPGSGTAASDEHDSFSPLDPVIERSSRFVPKPPGTEEDLRFYYGPYLVPPGWDNNRFDLELPVQNGLVTAVEPGIRRASDGAQPSHQDIHIHHAHWFALNPGSETDNYTFGLTDWFFGTGDEETRADFRQRSEAEPGGPIYGGHIGPHEPQPMIYMLHNKTAQSMLVWIVLEVSFIHGTMEQLNALGDRPYHEVTGILFGRTFDVPRDRKSRDGTYETAKDDPRGVIEWTSPIDGTIIGTGSHIHPGGLEVVVENYGPEGRPCRDDGRGYGGTLLLRSKAIWRNGVPFSEDFQMQVTHPAFRAPIRKGDRIRISGTYANKRHAWYGAMTHQGIYVDENQPPRGRCKPTLVGPAARKVVMSKRQRTRVRRACNRKATPKRRAACRRKARARNRIDPTRGVRNRAWGDHPPAPVCGKRFGARRCERPVTNRGPGTRTDLVTIANFQYRPGDRALPGEAGRPVRIPQGRSLTFVNADQAAGIRHSVTTCRWPCNGPYVANYPLPDGAWDSGTMGYDPVDGGSPSPITQTPPDLDVGRYSYFCRLHPFMRGAFEVVPE